MYIISNSSLCCFVIPVVSAIIVWSGQLLQGIRVSRLHVSSNRSCNKLIRVFTHSLTEALLRVKSPTQGIHLSLLAITLFRVFYLSFSSSFHSYIKILLALLHVHILTIDCFNSDMKIGTWLLKCPT